MESGSRIRVPNPGSESVLRIYMIINTNIMNIITHTRNVYIVFFDHNIIILFNMTQKDYKEFGSRMRVPDPGPGFESRIRVPNPLCFFILLI